MVGHCRLAEHCFSLIADGLGHLGNEWEEEDSCIQLGLLDSDSFGAALNRACKAIPTNVAIRIEG